MARKKSDRKQRVDSLKVRDRSKVKGGLAGTLSQVVKTLGEGLVSMARRG